MGIQCNRLNRLVPLVDGNDFTFWTYNRRMAIVLNSVAILTYSVYPNYISQIFNGTGLQQCVPGVDACSWPVGHINCHVIRRSFRNDVPSVSTPNWKTQVITNEGADSPALPCRNQET